MTNFGIWFLRSFLQFFNKQANNTLEGIHSIFIPKSKINCWLIKELECINGKPD